MSMDKDKCRTKWESDEIRGWIAKLEGNCENEMKLIESLPEKKREYLKRRIDYSSKSSSTESS
jgi:hypothetical protein